MNEEELEARIEKLEAEVEEILRRNHEVEENKRWETSLFRRLSLLGLTYVCTAVVFHAIGVENYFANALIPTVGYFLSTLALPYLRKYWRSQS